MINFFKKITAAVSDTAILFFITSISALRLQNTEEKILDYYVHNSKVVRIACVTYCRRCFSLINLLTEESDSGEGGGGANLK